MASEESRGCFYFCGGVKHDGKQADLRRLPGGEVRSNATETGRSDTKHEAPTNSHAVSLGMSRVTLNHQI